MKTLTKSVHCYLDSARGQYIPRDFARETKRECIEGVKAKDLDYLARGPGGVLDEDQTLTEDETERGEFYYDTWETVCDNAIVVDPESGNRFRLHQDSDLFLVPEEWEYDEDSQSFRAPESDTLSRFTLPSYWASYLINGDSSGIEEPDIAACDSFIERENLKEWTCADCSKESHFAPDNDATNLGGDVLEYTFVRIGGDK